MQFFLTFQGKKYLFLLKTIDFMNKFDKKKFLIYISSAGRQKPAGVSRICTLKIKGSYAGKIAIFPPYKDSALCDDMSEATLNKAGIELIKG